MRKDPQEILDEFLQRLYRDGESEIPIELVTKLGVVIQVSYDIISNSEASDMEKSLACCQHLGAMMLMSAAIKEECPHGLRRADCGLCVKQRMHVRKGGAA